VKASLRIADGLDNRGEQAGTRNDVPANGGRTY
jgi:hypothetical protein